MNESDILAVLFYIYNHFFPWALMYQYNITNFYDPHMATIFTRSLLSNARTIIIKICEGT